MAWLSSVDGVKKALADALLKDEGTRAEESQLELIRRLGAATSREAGEARLRALLSRAGVLDTLVRALWAAMEKLTEASAATGAELQAKFLEDGAGMLSYGDLSTFFGGLEGKIGAPNPKVQEKMAEEHTAEGGDRHERFKTGN